VIGLPTNLFYGTGIPAAVLVFNRSEAGGAQRKVLFVERRASSAKARRRTSCAKRT
jgi:type I restriction enzyme M protein